MTRRLITLAGIFLMLLWTIWWGVSLDKGELLWADKSSIHIPAFGVDFYRNTETPTRIWLTGENPYSDKELLFAYPPIVTRVFSWVYFFTPQHTLKIWVVALGLIAALSAAFANTARKNLGLRPLPSLLAVALIVFSTPVIFAMERGNYDLLIIPLMMAGILLLEKKAEHLQLVGGLLVAVAIWLKLYPIFIIIGLLATRRYKAIAWVTFWMALIGMSDIAELMQFHLNTVIHVARAKGVAGLGGYYPCAWNHSLSLSWPAFWKNTPLAHLNGSIGATVVIGALIAWTGKEIWRVKHTANLLLPYLLWLVSAATFLPPVSNDYNLAPLPIAMLVIWQGKSKFNYLALLAMIIWCEPIGTTIHGERMLLVKLIALVGTAWLIVQHSRAQANEGLHN